MKKYSISDLILWENNDFIAVNKPPFLSTLEDRADPVNLLALARTYCETAQACHRLDKDTSGIIVFARNPEAYRHMSMQFEHRQVEKIYHAIVDGVHDFQQHLVDAPILAAPDGIVKINKRLGKPAQTYFTTLVAYRQHSLIECRPITGRMHQIRIHLSLLNASITGDEQYGGKPLYLSTIKRGFNLKKHTEEQPLMKRMALHAKSLIFKLMNGEKLTLDAPYPKDFQALLRQLEANK